MICDFVCGAFWWLAAWFGAVSLLTYLVPFVLANYVLPEQDLKKKYGAEWAMVTGASSGIGLAIARRLASQRINVVLVALDDAVLASADEALRREFPDVEFVRCGVNLGAPGYLAAIEAELDARGIALLFNNAGFITTGFFAESPLGRLQANMECNASCQVPITHAFLRRSIAARRRGAVFFTSSPANAFANPISALYGSTKAFVTEFATSLAPEIHEYGIDVCVVHPSPVSTSFYAQAHDVDTINIFKRTGITPDVIASFYFSAVGRLVVMDHGWFSLFAKLLTRSVGYELLADIMKYIMPLLPDYKLVKKGVDAPESGKKKEN